MLRSYDWMEGRFAIAALGKEYACGSKDLRTVAIAHLLSSGFGDLRSLAE